MSPRTSSQYNRAALYSQPVVYGLKGAAGRATTLLPEHPALGAPKSTIAQSKFSVSCVDRSSWVCSGGAWDELRIRRIDPAILAQF